MTSVHVCANVAAVRKESFLAASAVINRSRSDVLGFCSRDLLAIANFPIWIATRSFYGLLQSSVSFFCLILWLLTILTVCGLISKFKASSPSMALSVVAAGIAEIISAACIHTCLKHIKRKSVDRHRCHCAAFKRRSSFLWALQRFLVNSYGKQKFPVVLQEE